MKFNAKKFVKRLGLLVGMALVVVLVLQYNNIKRDYINLNDIVDYTVEDGVLTIQVEEVHNVERPYKTIEEYVVKKDMA